MDDDPVLRSLAEDLARDDPRLAALLGEGVVAPRRHRTRTVLILLVLTPALVVVALFVPPTVALGATAMLLAVASPLVVCWLCAQDGSAPRAY
jgi:Protein of unknown function (DUF3040)